jgi:protein-tyrosine phosphatase
MFHGSFQVNDVDLVRQRYTQTRNLLATLAMRPSHSTLSHIEMLLGAENYANIEFIEALESNRILTLNDSHFLLIEFPLDTGTTSFSLIIRRIRDKGYQPVLAHAERYQFVQRDPMILREFIEKGGLIQVNANSFMGNFWSKPRRTAHTLLKKKLVSVIASDGHRAHARQPDLGPAWAYLSKKFKSEEILRLMADNPSWLIDSVRKIPSS